MQLKGKTALVLGASRPVGRAIARSLAGRGVRLVLPWFDWPEDVRSLEDEFGASSANHRCLKVDLRKREEVQALAADLADWSGSLDILINNIERGGMPVVHGSYGLAVNRDQWQREMDTTLHAKWLVFEHCLGLLRKPAQAAVINISSIAALTGRSGAAGLLFSDGYAAANRGVASLTATWARLGAPTIRVNEIMLGIIDHRHGPGTRGWSLLSEKQRQAILAHTLLGRTGTPEEVARAVLFLLEDADFMTGTIIRLDGGFVLGGDRVPPLPEGVLER